MIFLALAALATQPVIRPAPQETEIVVTARRLKNWRGKASVSRRGSRCRTIQSTGEAGLDQIACDSLRYCMIRLTPEMSAASDLKLSKAVREERLTSLNRQLEDCGAEQHRVRVTDWVERRAAARSNNAQD